MTRAAHRSAAVRSLALCLAAALAAQEPAPAPAHPAVSPPSSPAVGGPAGDEATVLVQVLLPPPLGELAVRALREALGAGIAVAAVSIADDFAPAPGAVLFGVDDGLVHRLHAEQRLAAMPRDGAATGEVAVMPFALRYTFVCRPGELGTEPVDWRDLALQPELRGRLGLAAASVDPTPWLAAMQATLRDGGTEREGYGLWTALDARLWRPGQGHEAVRAAFLAGDAAAAVLPAVLANGLAAEPGVVFSTGFRGLPVRRVGIAVAAPLDARNAALAKDLAAAPVAAALRAHCGIEPAAGEVEVLDPVRSRYWLGHLQDEIAGQGRSVEQIADALDLAFFLLFALVIAGVWWHQRRRDANGDDREPGEPVQ